MKVNLITVNRWGWRNFTWVARTLIIKHSQVGVKMWIVKLYSKPERQIMWIELREYQVSSASYNPVQFITFSTLAEASSAANLCFKLLKYYKTFDSSKYFLVSWYSSCLLNCQETFTGSAFFLTFVFSSLIFVLIFLIVSRPQKFHFLFAQFWISLYHLFSSFHSHFFSLSFVFLFINFFNHFSQNCFSFIFLIFSFFSRFHSSNIFFIFWKISHQMILHFILWFPMLTKILSSLSYSLSLFTSSW